MLFLYFYIAMKIILYFFLFILLFSCKSDDSILDASETEEIIIVDDDPNNIRILSIGDSYTNGDNVCDSCAFPEQLTDSLRNHLNPNYTYNLDVIASLGLTTSDLLDALDFFNPSNNHDLVTILTGVNNQYQQIPFRIFFEQFPVLVNKAKALAKNDINNVIVISIPDYYYTPFGQNLSNNENISDEIDMYNTYIEYYCNQNGVTHVNITDITQLGLLSPELVSSDGINLSELAYSKFVERILPIAIEKID